METIPLEMDDIFDENDDDVPTTLPDLDDLDLEGNLEPMRDSRYDDETNEPAEGDEEPLTDNPELLAKLKSLKGASKNTTKRSYIKLDATRLTGERGIPILPKIFKKVKLKGKHHEAEDLKTIMHHLEHWGHRLFPKMPFAEVLERSERLGAKKEVQTCVKRIRLGMPVLATEMAESDEDVHREGDSTTTTTVTNTSNHQSLDDDEIDEFLSTAVEPEHTASQNEGPAQGDDESNINRINSTEKVGLSEEAKARIERNKKLAMERRSARLAGAQNGQTAIPILSSPSSQPHVTEHEMPEPDLSLKETEAILNDAHESHSLKDDLNGEILVEKDKEQNITSDKKLKDNVEKETESIINEEHKIHVEQSDLRGEKLGGNDEEGGVIDMNVKDNVEKETGIIENDKNEGLVEQDDKTHSTGNVSDDVEELESSNMEF